MLHSLHENLIGPNGAVALARNLQYCPVLEKLWCVHPRSMRDPTRPCAIILPTHAWPMPCATSRSPTVHDSRPTLARPLAVPQCLSSPRVSVSRLHDNRIGDAGALAIAAALKDPPPPSPNQPTLPRLPRPDPRLWQNRIGDAGARALALAVKDCRVPLDLRYGRAYVCHPRYPPHGLTRREMRPPSAVGSHAT